MSDHKSSISNLQSSMLSALLAAGMMLVALLAGNATAGDTWDGGGTNASWGTANNWDPDGAGTFNNTRDITFYKSGAAQLSNYLGGARTNRSLTFNADADSDVTIRTTTTSNGTTAANLTFDTDAGNATITVANGATGNHKVGDAGGNLVLSDNLVVTHDGSGTLTFGVAVSATANGVTKAGSGVLILGSTNSYTGLTQVDAGELRWGIANALSSGNVTVNNTATVNMQTYADTVGTVTLNAGGTISGSSGVLTTGTGGLVTTGGTISFSGAGGIALGGTNTAFTYNTSAGSETTASIDQIILGGGTIAKTFTIADGAAVSGIDVDITENLSNTAAANTPLTKAGAGVLQLSGSTANINRGTGTTAINDGSLLLNKSASVDAIGGSGLITVGDGTGAAGTAILKHTTASSDNQILNNAVTVNSDGLWDLNGKSETTSGALTINAAGQVTVGGGSLSVGALTNNGSLTTGGGNLTGTTLAMTGGSINAGAGTYNLGGAVTGNSSATLAAITATTLDLGAATRTFTIADNAGANPDMEITAAVANGTLAKAGAGQLQLSGSTANTAAFSISAGALYLNKSGAANAVGSGGMNIVGATVQYTATAGTDQIADAATVTLANGAGVATLDLNGISDTVGALTFGGASGVATSTGTVTTAAGTLTLNGNVTYIATGNPLGATVSGNLNLGGGTRVFDVADSTGAAVDLDLNSIVSNGGLTKTGAGVLRLRGINTYAGNTLVQAGTLAVTNTGSILLSPNVTVSNATLRLFHANALAASSSLYLDSNGSGSYGKADLSYANTQTQTVESLYLDGIKQERGTYGSTGSGALYQNNNWFANNGVLEVSPTALAVMNRAPSGLATDGATFNGFLSCTGASPTTVAVLWGELDGGQTWNWANTNWFDGNAWTNGSILSTNITGLAADKTYYYTFAATNTEAGVVASPSRVTATRMDVCVQPGGTAVYPYNAWPIAFSSIQPAVDYASANIATRPVVTVSNGSYGISASIAVSAGITVRSYGNGVTGGLANAALTTVQPSANSISIFTITHASAVVDGFTITGGYATGGGVNMTGGLVRDCIIRNNNIGDNKSGGGVYMTGGTVSNCVVKSNSKGGGSGEAGGIYATGGTIVFCEIVDNSSNEDSAGGIYANGAVTIRNCLIARNTAVTYGGGVYIGNNSAVIESCTIVANHAGNGTQGGGGIHRAALGTIRNCIVYNNTSGSATYKNAYSTSTANWTYNCTALPDVNGTSCTNGDPLFRNLLEGNYLLSTGSPCIDTGNDGVVTWGTDLAGNERKQDGNNDGSVITDMGAYEYVTALTCDFLASPRALIAAPTTYQSFGPAPFTVQFTGWADGTNLTGLVYRWDFDNDGSYEQEGLDLTSVSYTYTTAGVYNPRLQVTNSTAEVAEKLKSAYVSAGNTHYVRTSSPGASPPYTSWETAASNNIQAAINAATLNGSVVIISNGTYGITAQITGINILTVRSFEGGLSGASNTVVQRSGGSTRVFSVANTYAVLDGLTIRNGNGNGTEYSGMGVNMSAGLVKNCIIRDNGNNDNFNGAGVYMTGGTVSNCIIRSNVKGAGDRDGGGGVWASGGLITHCQITDNTVGNDDGGGLWMSGGTVRNCLIRNNTTANQGGGVWMDNSGVLAESCTIVANRADGGSTAGGGVYRNNGTVRNCVVYLNTAPNNTANANHYATAGFEYSASDPQPAGTGNILAGVTFQDPAANDYRLKPCAAVDSGSNQGWMTGAFDLVGNPRITNAVSVAQTVDMGAYEYLPGALEAGLFTADRTEVIVPAQVVFTSFVLGTNTDSLVYWWTFGDGNTANGSDKGVVTNTYASPGRYTVSLSVTNAAGEGSSFTRTGYIDAFGPIIYVATNSASPSVPYATWETAALTIGDAINAAQGDVVGDAGILGIVVLVSNGTYNITSSINIREPIIVRSYGNGVTGGLANAANTVVKNSSTANSVYPIFRITHASTAVQGFMIRDGRYNGTGTTEYGGGVNMTGGLLSDCIVTNNGAKSANGGGGGGITMTGGTVSNCVIVGNGWRGGAGNGIYMNGGSALVTHSRITDHSTSFASDGGNNAVNGGGVYINNGTLRNCLVARNQGRTITANTSQGGGVYMNAGTVESCTIVSNTVTATSGGGGVYRNGNGTVRNCIIYFNTEDGNLDNWVSSDADAQPNYTCTTPLPSYGANNTAADPLLAGDYTLAAGSPCIDTGDDATVTWATDLVGNARKQDISGVGTASVDMGAYEAPLPPPTGTLILLR